MKVHSQVVYLRYIFFGIVNRDTFIQMKFLRIYIQMTLFHILFSTLIRLLKIHEFIQMYHNYSENSIMRFKYLNKLFFRMFCGLRLAKVLNVIFWHVNTCYYKCVLQMSSINSNFFKGTICGWGHTWLQANFSTSDKIV